LEKIIKNLPLKEKDVTKLHVTFLSEKPSSFPTTDVERFKDKSEKFSYAGREIYLFCPNGYGRTKLHNIF